MCLLWFLLLHAEDGWTGLTDKYTSFKIFSDDQQKLIPKLFYENIAKIEISYIKANTTVADCSLRQGTELDGTTRSVRIYYNIILITSTHMFKMQRKLACGAYTYKCIRTICMNQHEYVWHVNHQGLELWLYSTYIQWVTSWLLRNLDLHSSMHAGSWRAIQRSSQSGQTDQKPDFSQNKIQTFWSNGGQSSP